jgi:uncharacterized lipoprotein YajG
MIRRLIIFPVAFFMTACAITQQEAKLDPTLFVTNTNEGNGIEVGVVTIDERPTRNLGQRAPGGAQIVYNGDLAVLLHGKIVEGLRKKGFKSVGGAIDGVNIKVEIRSLNYEVSSGWFTGGIDVDSAIKAYVTGSGSAYEKLYRSSKEDRVVFASTAGANNERLNGALSEVLRRMFDDQALINALKAPK